MRKHFIVIFSIVAFLAVAGFFLCNNAELKSWYEWHCRYSSTRGIFRNEKYIVSQKEAFKELVDFLIFCDASYDDRVDSKESNLRTAKLLSKKLSNNQELKEKLLEEGRFETMLKLHEKLLADREWTQERHKLIEWRLKKISEYAKNGKISVLCQDEDYVSQIGEIYANFLQNITPPPIKEEDRQKLLERVKNKRGSFISEMKLKNLTGDGMSEESPLDLRNMQRHAIYDLVHYAHIVCDSTVVGLRTSYSQVDDICEAVLYDKTSKSTYTLYFLIDSKVLMDYITL